MELYRTICSVLWFPLCLCNWAWVLSGDNVRRTVQGTLEHAVARARNRRFRWPGAMFLPLLVPNWIVHYNKALWGTWWGVLLIPLIDAIFALFLLRDLAQLLRELDEDDDDIYNKAKRKLKSLRQSVSAAFTFRPLIPVPVRGGVR